MPVLSKPLSFSVSEQTEKYVLQYLNSGLADKDGYNWGKFKEDNEIENNIPDPSKTVRDRLDYLKKIRAMDYNKFSQHCVCLGVVPLPPPAPIQDEDRKMILLGRGLFLCQATLDCNPPDLDVSIADDGMAAVCEYTKYIRSDPLERLSMFKEETWSKDLNDFVVQQVVQDHEQTFRKLDKKSFTKRFNLFEFGEEMVHFFVNKTGTAEGDVIFDVDRNGNARITFFAMTAASMIEKTVSPLKTGMFQHQTPAYVNTQIPNKIVFGGSSVATGATSGATPDTRVDEGSRHSNNESGSGRIGIRPHVFSSIFGTDQSEASTTKVKNVEFNQTNARVEKLQDEMLDMKSTVTDLKGMLEQVLIKL